MKIAFVGNENNTPFAFCRYLRDRGWDAELFMLNKEAAHFHPSMDSLDNAYQAYCHRLPFAGGHDIGLYSKRRLAAFFEDFDFLIGHNYAPAYIAKAGRKLDVFVPHGADIYSFVAAARQRYYRPIADYLRVKYQRKGIGECRVIHSDFHQPEYEQNIARHGGHAERWRLPFPTLYAPAYDALKADAANPIHQQLLALRAQYPFLAFAPARQLWHGPVNAGSKGNDEILLGWKHFHQQMPKLAKQLVMLEYGPDVAYSKQLIYELAIEDQVTWLPILSRKDLMIIYRQVDTVLVEFIHGWITGGVLFEALINNKPMITYRNEEGPLWDGDIPLYDIYNAHDAPTIGAQLLNIYQDMQQHTLKGLNGRQWYDRHVVAPSITAYERLFEAAKQ